MFGVVDASLANESQCIPVDWGKCILCQLNTVEKLVDPSKNPRRAEEGYEMLATNLGKFHDIGALPFPIDILQLDDGSSRKNTLSKNNASWHKSCYLKCNNTKLIRAINKYRKEEAESLTPPSPVKTRRVCDSMFEPKTCLFCGLPGSRSDPLHKVQTKNCDEYIRKNAIVLNDSKITSKVSERCDLISLEAEYHKKCYSHFRNRVRDHEDPKCSDSSSRQIEALAFSGLVAYINECRTEEGDACPAFRMKQLATLSARGMRELGVECEVHTTRLKERLLEECPHLQSCDMPGQESLLAFRSDVEYAVRSLTRRNYDAESKTLYEAAEVVRADIFQSRDTYVEDNAETNLSSDTTPASLLTLMKMIINGPSTKKTTEDASDYNDHVAKSIAQLLTFHAVKHRKGAKRRHSQKQETPTPVYLAMKIYGETRSKKLIDLTCELGFSISYDRLNTILTRNANEVCAFYEKAGVVCPPSLVRGVFTTAAVDNLDHNTTSTSASSAFHGTAISIMQHLRPGQSGEKLIVSPIGEDDRKRRNVKALPVHYTAVQPFFENLKSAKCVMSEKCTFDIDGKDTPYSEEQSWLQKTITEASVTWGAHHVALHSSSSTDRHQTVAAVLPLFTEQAHSAAMMIHTMNVVKRTTQHLNPDQTSVIVADQPLYALLKQIQYKFPLTHGESEFFVFMGGLHIEMTALRVAGQWLNGSGWIDALLQAEFTTKGRAESLISAAHVTRTRYAHQVTLAALSKLQQEAYSDYREGSEDIILLDFDTWRRERSKDIPQFKYWDLAMCLELLVLQFVRSIRIADFSLYANSLRRLVPWFFALDHVNYARWVAVHIRDLANLREVHPDLAKKFEDGLFTARKSNRPFSCMALDQAHEQLNALLKGDGGMVGLTERPESLLKWSVAGPELASTVLKFEREVLHLHNDDPFERHHEGATAQQKFSKDVSKVVEVFNELGNPFLEESSDLYNIDSKKVAPSEAVQAVMRIEDIGETQYELFVEERLRKCTRHLLDPIKLNKLPSFGTTVRTGQNKSKSKITGLKSDCSLFSRLYIATSEHRSGNLDTFFEHENNPFPPSISVCGGLRPCTKSDLVKCFIDICPESETQNVPSVDAKILDGPAIIHMLNPGQSTTFKDYAERVFVPYARRELSSVRRIDFVWDRYSSDSLKNSTRERRGDGIRTRVALSTKIPQSWPSFLRDSANKEELFQLLAMQISCLEEDGKEVCSTLDSSVVTTSGRNTSGSLSPCNHEEADTRMIVHLADAVAQGNTKILLRTVDTDVLVIAISCVQEVNGLQELWVHLGTGKNCRYLAAHSIAETLGPEKSKALPMFHAFTGCDTVSSFSGKGKKSAFDTWKSFPDVTTGFTAASEGRVDDALPLLEKFVVALYDRSSSTSSVNECRRALFTKKDRQLENLPPTLDALKLHILRATYQGGHVWSQCLSLQQELPDPASWGWHKTEKGWQPVWSTLPVASKACLELVRCKCKKGCGARCNCIKRDLKCTNLCSCDGECRNNK